jgi:hypothetical protein
MHFPDVRIVGAISRSQSSIPGEAALEFFRHLSHRAFFERIGATAEEKSGAREDESGDDGPQARRILKKVVSDK